jgi:hypothetical protein
MTFRPTAEFLLPLPPREQWILVGESTMAAGPEQKDQRCSPPVDLARLMEPVAIALLGAPNKSMSSATELRFGNRGSMSVDRVKGVWHDWEANEGGGVLKLIERETGKAGAEAFDWMRREGIISDDGRPNSDGEARATSGSREARPKLGLIVETYDYLSANGEFSYQVTRHDPKDFRQRRRGKNGEWVWDLDGVQRIPYRLPELIEATSNEQMVVIPEGERDVNNLRAIGLSATCNSGGAGSWKPELNQWFKGADVVIMADNDPQATNQKTGELRYHRDGRPVFPGQDHARDVARQLSGIAARVRVIMLGEVWPECPPKGDVSDFLKDHSREQLDALIEQAPDYAGEASDDAYGFPVVHWQGETDARAAQPWLVAGLLPEVGTGLISGQWGTFKTFAAMDLAATIAWGGSFLDYMVRRQGGTLFVATEGSFQIPIRLQALIEKKSTNAKKKIPFAWIDSCPSLLNPDGVKQIVAGAKKIDEQMRAKFGVPLVAVVVDTVVNAAGYSKAGDENDAAIGAALMQALNEIAKQTNTFVFGIDHFGKAVETGTRGSSAKEAGADVVLALLGDKDVSGRVTRTRLAIRKNRAGESGKEFPFTAPVIDMGQDDFGLPITTRIIEWGKKQDPAASAKAEEWANRALKTLRCALMAVVAEAGTDFEPQAGGPTVRAVDVDFVRTDFYKNWFVDGDDPKRKKAAKRRAFERAINDARARQLIGIDKNAIGTDMVWLTRPGDA